MINSAIRSGVAKLPSIVAEGTFYVFCEILLSFPFYL